MVQLTDEELAVLKGIGKTSTKTPTTTSTTQTKTTSDGLTTSSKTIKDSLEGVEQKSTTGLKSIWESTKGFVKDIRDVGSTLWNRYVSNKDRKKGINDYKQYNEYMGKMASSTSEDEYNRLYNEMIGKNIINEKKYKQYQEEEKDGEKYQFEQAKAADRDTFNQRFEEAMQPYMSGIQNRYQIDCISSAVQKMEKQYELFHDKIMTAYEDTRDDRLLEKRDELRKEYEDNIIQFTTKRADNLIKEGKTYSTAYKDTIANDTYRNLANGITTIERQMSNNIYQWTIGKNLGDMVSINPLTTMYNGLLALKNTISWGLSQVSVGVEELKELGGVYDVTEKLNNLYVFDEAASTGEHIAESARWLWRSLLDYAPQTTPAIIELVLFKKVGGEEALAKSLDTLADASKVGKIASFERLGGRFGSRLMSSLIADNLIYDEAFQTFTGRPITNEEENINLVFNLAIDGAQALIRGGAKWIKPALKEAELKTGEISEAALKMIKNEDNEARAIEKYYLLRGRETTEGTNAFKEASKTVSLEDIKNSNPKLYDKIIKVQEGSVGFYERLSTYKGSINDILLEAENTFKRKDLKKLSTLELIDRTVNDVRRKSKFIREAGDNLLLGTKTTGEIIYKGIEKGIINEEYVRTLIKSHGGMEGMDDLIIGLAKSDNDLIQKGMYTISKGGGELSNPQVVQLYNNVLADLLKQHPDLVGIGEMAGTFMKGKDGLFRNIFDYDSKGFNLDEFIEHIKSEDNGVFGSDRIALMDNLNARLNYMEKQMIDNPNAQLEQDVTDIFRNINGFNLNRFYEKSTAEKEFIKDTIKNAGFRVIEDENGIKVMADINTLQKIKTNIGNLGNKPMSSFNKDDVDALKFLYIGEFTSSFNKYADSVGNFATISKKAAEKGETPKFNKTEFKKGYKCWFDKMFDVKETKGTDGKITKTYSLKLQFGTDNIQKEFKQLIDNNAKFKDIEKLAATNIIQDITSKAIKLNSSDEKLLNDIRQALTEGQYVDGYTKEIDPVVNALFNQVKWLKDMGIGEENSIKMLSEWFGQLAVDKDTLQILSRIDSDYLYKGIISRLIMQNDNGFMLFQNSIKRTLEKLPINIRRENEGIAKILDYVEFIGQEEKTINEMIIKNGRLKDINKKLGELNELKNINNKTSLGKLNNVEINKKIKTLEKEKADIEKYFKAWGNEDMQLAGIPKPTVVNTDKIMFMSKMQESIDLINPKQFEETHNGLIKQLRNKGKVKKEGISMGSDRILITDLSKVSDNDLKLLGNLVAYKSMSELGTYIPGIADKLGQDIYASLLKLREVGYDKHISFGLGQSVDEAIDGINLTTLGESKIIQSLLGGDDVYSMAGLMGTRSVDEWLSELAYKGKYIYMGGELRDISYLKMFDGLNQFSNKTDDLFEFMEEVERNIKESNLVDKDDILAELVAKYVQIHQNVVKGKTFEQLVGDAGFIGDITDKIDALKKIKSDLGGVTTLYGKKLGKKRVGNINKIEEQLDDVINMYERMKELAVGGVKTTEDLEGQLTAKLGEGLYIKAAGIQEDLPSYPSWIATEMIGKGGFMQKVFFPEVGEYNGRLVTGNFLVNDLYNKGTNKKFTETDLTNMDLKLLGKKLVIFDIETTGKNLKKNPEVTELSYTIIEEGKEPKKITKYFRINKETSYPDNGLTKDVLDTKADFDFTNSLKQGELDEFKELIGDKNVYFIAHNGIQFDKPILEKWGVNFGDSKVIDTEGISKLLYPLNGTWKQEELVKAENIQKAMERFITDNSRHNAEYDVEELQYLFYYLYDNLLKNGKVPEGASTEDILNLMEDLSKRMDIKMYSGEKEYNKKVGTHVKKSWKEEVLGEFERGANKYAEEADDAMSELLEKFEGKNTVSLNDLLLTMGSNLQSDGAIQLYNGLKKILPANAVISKDKLLIGNNVKNEYILYRNAGGQLSFDGFILNRNVATILSNFGMYNETTIRALNKYMDDSIMKDIYGKIVETNANGVVKGTNDTTLLSSTIRDLYQKNFINIDGYNNINDLIDDVTKFAGENYQTELQNVNKLLYQSQVTGGEDAEELLAHELTNLLNNIFQRRRLGDVANQELDEAGNVIKGSEGKFANNWNDIVPTEDLTGQWSRQNVHPMSVDVAKQETGAYKPKTLIEDICLSLEKAGAIEKGKAQSLVDSIDIFDIASDWQDLVDAFALGKFSKEELLNSPMYKRIFDRVRMTAEVNGYVTKSYKKRPAQWQYASEVFKKDTDNLSKLEEYLKSIDEGEGIAPKLDREDRVVETIGESEGYVLEDISGQAAAVESVDEGISRANYEGEGFEGTSKVDQLRETRSTLNTVLEDYVIGGDMTKGLKGDTNLEFSNKFIIEEDSNSMVGLNGLDYNSQINIASIMDGENTDSIVKFADEKISQLEKKGNKGELNTYYNVRRFAKGEFKELTAKEYIDINGVADLVGKDIKGGEVNSATFDTIYRTKEEGKNVLNKKTFDITSDDLNLYKVVDNLLGIFQNNGKVKINISQGKNNKVTSIYLNKDNFWTSGLGQDLLERMGFSRSMGDAGSDFVFREIESKLYEDALAEQAKGARLREAYLDTVDNVKAYENWDEETFKDCLSLSDVHGHYIGQFSEADKEALLKKGVDNVYKKAKLTETDKMNLSRLKGDKEDFDYLLTNGYITKADLDDVAKGMVYENADGKVVNYVDMDDYIMRNYYEDEIDRKVLGNDIMYNQKFKNEVYSRYNSNMVNTRKKLKEYNKPNIDRDGVTSFDNPLERLRNYTVQFTDGGKEKTLICDGYRQDFIESRETYEATGDMLENDTLMGDTTKNINEEYNIIQGDRRVVDEDSRNAQMHELEGSDSYMTLKYIDDPDEIVVRMRNVDNQDEVYYGVLKINNHYTTTSNGKVTTTYEFFPFKGEDKFIDPYPAKEGTSITYKRAKYNKWSNMEKGPKYVEDKVVTDINVLVKKDGSVEIKPSIGKFSKFDKKASKRAEEQDRIKFLEKQYNSEEYKAQRRNGNYSGTKPVIYNNKEGIEEVRELTEQGFLVRDLKAEEQLMKDNKRIARKKKEFEKWREEKIKEIRGDSKIPENGLPRTKEQYDAIMDDINSRIANAKEYGDLSENAEYQQALDDKQFVKSYWSQFGEAIDKNDGTYEWGGLIYKRDEKVNDWVPTSGAKGINKGVDEFETETASLGGIQKYDWENHSYSNVTIVEKAAKDGKKVSKDGDEILETSPFDFVSKKFIENRYLNRTNNDIIKQSPELQQIIGMRSNFIRTQGVKLKDAVTKFEETVAGLTKQEQEEIYGRIKSAANRYIGQRLDRVSHITVDGLTKEQQDALNGILEVFKEGDWRGVYQLASIQTKDGFQGMLKNIAHNHMGASLEYYKVGSKNAVKNKLTSLVKQFESNEKEIGHIVEDIVGDPLGAGKLYNFLTGVRSARRFIKYGPLFPLTGVLMFINSAVMGNIRYVGERRGFLDIMRSGAFDRLITKAGDTIQIGKETKTGLGLADSLNRANEIMFNSNSDLGGSWFDKALDWMLGKLPVKGKTRELVETMVKGGTHSAYDFFAQGSVKSMALAKALSKNGITARNIDNFADLLEAGKVSAEDLNKILADTEMIYSRFFTNSATSLLSRHKFSRWYMVNALQGYVLNRSDEMFSSIKDAINRMSRRRQLANQKIGIAGLEHLEGGIGFKRSDFVDYLQNDNQELQAFLMNVLMSMKFGYYFDKAANGGEFNPETYGRYLVDTSDFMSSVGATFFWNILSSPFEGMIDYAEYTNSNYDDFNIGDGLTVAGVKLFSQICSQFFREGKFINALSSGAVALGQTGDLDFSYDVLVDEFRKIASGLGRFQLVEGTNTYGLTNMSEQGDFIGQILFNNQYTSTAGRFADKLQSLQTVDKILNGENGDYFKQTIIPYLPVIGPMLSNAITGQGYSFSATKYKELIHIMDKDNIVNWLNDYDIENDHGIFSNSDWFGDEQIGRLYQELTAFDYPNKQYIGSDKFDTGYAGTLEPIKEDIFTEELLRDLDWDKEKLDKWLMSGATNKEKGLLKVMAAADASRPGSSKIVLSYLANRYEYNLVKELTGKYGNYKDIPVEIQNEIKRQTVELYYPYMFVADKTSWYKAITEYVGQHYPLFEDLYKDDDLTGYTSTLGYMDMIMYQQAKEGNVNAKFIKNSWSMLSKYFKNEQARINAINYTMDSIDNAGFTKGQATAAKMGTLAANMDIYDKYQKNGMALSLFGDDIENYNYFVWGVLQDINDIGYEVAKGDLKGSSYGYSPYKNNKYKYNNNYSNYNNSGLGDNNIPEAEKFVPAATKYLNGWTPQTGKTYTPIKNRTYQPGQTLDYYRKVYEAHVKALSDKLVGPRPDEKGKNNYSGKTYDWQYKYGEGFRNRGYVNPARLVFPKHKQPAYSTKVLANMPGASG